MSSSGLLNDTLSLVTGNSSLSFNDTQTISPEELQQQALVLEQLREFQDVFINVHVIAIVCLCIGITGSILTLVTVWGHPRLRRSHSHRLIAYLALADLLFLVFHLSDHCVSYSHREFPIIPGKSLPGGDSQSSECRGMGFMTMWFAFGSTLWPVFFPVNIISRIQLNQTPPEWLSIVGTWGLALTIEFIALASGGPQVYGGAVFYCAFFDDDYNFYFGALPILIAFFLVFALYSYVGVHFWMSLKSSALDLKQKKKYQSIIYKLGIFPLIFLATWLPYIMQSIWQHEYVTPTNPLPWSLVYVTVSLSNLGGFFNWVAYASLNGQIREYYWHLLMNGLSNVPYMPSQTWKTSGDGTANTMTRSANTSSKYEL